jgi:hypothetical protein
VHNLLSYTTSMLQVLIEYSVIGSLLHDQDVEIDNMDRAMSLQLTLSMSVKSTLQCYLCLLGHNIEQHRQACTSDSPLLDVLGLFRDKALIELCVNGCESLSTCVSQ